MNATDRNTIDRNTIDALPCGVCKVRTDENLTILYGNIYFYEMYGYGVAPSETVGFQDLRSVIFSGDWQAVRHEIQRRSAVGGERFQLEYRCIHKKGTILWMLARCTRDAQDPHCITGVVLDITDRKQTEERLRISEEENRLAMQHTSSTVDIYEVATRTLIQPAEAAEWFAAPHVVVNAPYRAIERGLVDEESQDALIGFFDAMNRGHPTGRAVLRMRAADGRFHWLSAQYTMIFGGDGSPQRAVISYEDVTERREKELAYKKWSQLFDTKQKDTIGYYEYNLTKDIYERSEWGTTQMLPEYIRTYTGTILYMSEYFIHKTDLPAYLKTFDRKNLLLKYYEGQQEIKLEHRRRNGQGDLIWALGTIQLIQDPFGTDVKAFVHIQNIDTTKKRELGLKRLSERDALTGLFNRRMVVDKITEALEHSVPDQCHAVVMTDLDHFKQLNDSYGHYFGDKALRDLADTLRRSLRDKDFCGRMGGDEFVIFLSNVDPKNDMEGRMDSLMNALCWEYPEGAKVSVSLGLALFPRDGKDFDTLYERADVALYESKRRPDRHYAVYHCIETEEEC